MAYGIFSDNYSYGGMLSREVSNTLGMHKPTFSSLGFPDKPQFSQSGRFKYIVRDNNNIAVANVISGTEISNKNKNEKQESRHIETVHTEYPDLLRTMGDNVTNDPEFLNDKKDEFLCCIEYSRTRELKLELYEKVFKMIEKSRKS